MSSFLERYKELLAPKGGILANTIIGHAPKAINAVQKGVNNFVNTNKFINSPTPNKKDDPSLTVRQAVGQTLQAAPRGFGNLYRKNVPVVGGMFGRTAETIGSGVTDLLSSGYKVASTPNMSAGDVVKTGAQGLYGYGKILGAGLPFFQGANALASAGGNTPLARVSAGAIEGLTGIGDLAAQDVQSQNIKANILGNEFEFDPYRTAGSMLGFTRNPINSKIFSATEKFNILKAAASPQARIAGFIATNTLRGAAEDILMSLKDLPENVSRQEKLNFLFQNGLMGAASELTMRGAGEGVTKLKETEIGIQIFDMLRNAIKRVPEPELRRIANEVQQGQPRTPQGRYDRVMKVFPSDLQTGRSIRETQAGGIDRRTGKRVKFVGDIRQEAGMSRFGEGTESAMGAIAGFEPEYDENGRLTGFGYDPAKGMLFAGLLGGRKALGFDKSNKFSSTLDKKPRFEIDDSGAKLKGELKELLPKLQQGKQTLGDILDHKELYKQYPELKKMKVGLSLVGDFGQQGSYDPKTRQIMLSSVALRDRSTLLHEIQHAIQEVEGFARGGNPLSVMDIPPRVTGPDKEVATQIKRVLDMSRTLNKDYKRWGEMPPKWLNSEAVEKIKTLNRKQLEDIASSVEDVDPFSNYQRLSGELEARAVQRRMDMPASKRTGVDPYSAEAIATTGKADPKDFITRFDSGESASVEGPKTSKLPDTVIKDEVARLKEQLGGVSLAGEGDNLYRSSANPTWYRNFYSGMKRAPSAGEWKELAEENILKGTLDDFWNQPGAKEYISELTRPKIVSKAVGPNDPMLKEWQDSYNIGKDIVRPKVTQKGTGQTQTSGVTKAQTKQSLSYGDNGLKTSTTQRQPSLQLQQSRKVQTPNRLNQSSEAIIQEGRATIGKRPGDPSKTTKQSLNDLYTQFVDRYHPISRASAQVKKVLKTKGAELRPEVDPDYLVRRLTGAGGIADTRFRRELNPVLKEMENLKIDKTDMDVYLAHKRMAGFGDVGRDVYGANPEKSKRIVAALEAKYGGEIGQIAEKLYRYQDKGFQEMVDAGFISPENAKLIKEQNPDYSPLFRVMDDVDEYLGVPTRKAMQGSQPIQRIKGSTRQIESPIESVIGNTFRQRAAIEKNAVAKSIVNLQKIDPSLGFTKVSKAGADTITVWNGGKKEFWRVGQDIADVAKGANEENMNLVLKLLQKPASLLRQGATGRNPDFMIPNVVRDQLDAGVASKYGYIPFVDYFSGLKSMLTNDDVFKKWEASGAKIDLGELSGKKSVEKLFDEKTQKKNLLQWLSAGLDVMGKYSEQPTRVGLFKKAYKKTGNEMLAMMESRDSTVDFARMGTKMKVANSIVPFLNVGVQGFDKMIRAAKNNPTKVAFMMTTYAVAPQVASTIYNLINHPDEYGEIPEYVKEDNYILINGRTEDGTVSYKTIAKGNIAPLAANPVQSLLEYAFDNDKAAFKEMAMRTLSSSLPVVGDGGSLKEIGIKTIGSNLPQAIKPITENLLNKSFYKYDPNKEETKDIVPFYLKDKPAYQQTYKFTPELYQKIGQVVNVSPLQVQNAMEGYLAGYAKIPAQITEIVKKVGNGERITPNEVPMIRRFLAETYPTSGSKKVQKVQDNSTLMERISGNASAAEKATVDGVFAPGVAERQRVETSYDDAIKIMKEDGNTEQKIKRIEELGLTQDQVAYDMKTRLSDDLQLEQVAYELQNVDQKDFGKTLLEMRKPSPGSRKPLLTDTIINKMVKEGLIDSGTAKALKSVTFDDKTGKPTAKGKSGTKKVKKLPASVFKPLPKVKVSRVQDRNVNIKAPKLNLQVPTFNGSSLSEFGSFNPQVNTSGFARARVRA